jgi:hypothetical protein
MPYETHWEADGILWVYTGAMSDDDVLRANLDLYDDPRFPSIRYQIADFQLVDAFTATAQTVRKLSRMDREQSARNPLMKVAIVASSPLTRGIASLYVLSAADTPWSIKVFDALDDAREWLGA